MILEEDLKMTGEKSTTEEDEWLIYKKDKDDPFLRYMSAKFMSNLTYSELALNESLLHLYMSGMVKIRLDEGREPLVQLTDDGGNIMVANITASLGPIAEA